MNTTDDNDNPMSCANCGKGEEDSISLKNCMACKMVKYCSRDCQKAHRSQHKKECRKRAVELHDEALFKQPPQLEDCPICFMRVPSMNTGLEYNTCCGKIMCSGCIHAGANVGVDKLCPFCRTPAPTSEEEAVKRVKKRVEIGDAHAMFELGCYFDGKYGLPQDRDSALKLWHEAAELGSAASYYNIGHAYFNGEGVARDEKKAKHYYELAAMRGDISGRHNLGCSEGRAGNIDMAVKHFMIAVECGDNESLKMIQQLYSRGHATRDDYAKALKAYQAYLKEIKSDDRDKAAAFSDRFKYYE